MCGADAGLEKNRRFALALLIKVNAATAADIHIVAVTGVNAAIAEAAQVLIHGSGESEKRNGRENPKNNVHRPPKTS
jgi:hypothetical protein